MKEFIVFIYCILSALMFIFGHTSKMLGQGFDLFIFYYIVSVEMNIIHLVIINFKHA